jgi:hypothetical protein
MNLLRNITSFFVFTTREEANRKMIALVMLASTGLFRWAFFPQSLSDLEFFISTFIGMLVVSLVFHFNRIFLITEFNISKPLLILLYLGILSGLAVIFVNIIYIVFFFSCC